MLDDYATVRRYIDGFNRVAREIADRNPRSPILPIRSSDTEVIRMALSHAAAAMREEQKKAQKAGQRSLLD